MPSNRAIKKVEGKRTQGLTSEATPNTERKIVPIHFSNPLQCRLFAKFEISKSKRLELGDFSNLSEYHGEGGLRKGKFFFGLWAELFNFSVID